MVGGHEQLVCGWPGLFCSHLASFTPARGLLLSRGCLGTCQGILPHRTRRLPLAESPSLPPGTKCTGRTEGCFTPSQPLPKRGFLHYLLASGILPVSSTGLEDALPSDMVCFVLHSPDGAFAPVARQGTVPICPSLAQSPGKAHPVPPRSSRPSCHMERMAESRLGMRGFMCLTHIHAKALEAPRHSKASDALTARDVEGSSLSTPC